MTAFRPPVAPPARGTAGDLPPTGALADALRHAAADLASLQPPPAVHAAVQRAWAARLRPVAPAVTAAASTPARWSVGPGLFGGAAAFTAVVLVSVALWLAPSGRDAAPGAVRDARPLPSLALQLAAARGSDFLPVLPRERWPAASTSGAAPAWLVQTEMPGERLASLGLPFDPARAGESVRAELLVHPNGDVLAVRFLR